MAQTLTNVIVTEPQAQGDWLAFVERVWILMESGAIYVPDPPLLQLSIIFNHQSKISHPQSKML
jgi:hypothetical protein